jgi:exodeoxyribonuclease V alpha subunit
MPTQSSSQTEVITETIRGIVDRVTYHNPDNGWSVLRVLPFNNPHQQETVIVHQSKVYAGATMEFHGAWTVYPKFGRQFKAIKAVERKPATTAALEKYLGSGLIKGVGPKTAKKIVQQFGKKTLDIFEGEIERLTEIKEIAKKKLEMIRDAWIERYCRSKGISLSDEQTSAVKGIVCERFSILTGGPGCGKTTLKVLLAASGKAKSPPWS